MPRVCLNMIVRNERQVLERCLASVRPLIDAWLIVDTGSTDGTQALIRELLSDLPGDLIERPWVDFAHNRNEALGFAQPLADFLLIIDADEVLCLDADFAWPDPMPDALFLRHFCAGSDVAYELPKLVRSALPWRWVGVVHEYLTCDAEHQSATAQGIEIVGHFDGARNQDAREKYLGDAGLLARSLATDPDNLRDLFYLAQSLRDAGELESAITRYEERAERGGWEQERWYARYQVAVLRERIGDPMEVVVRAYEQAHRERRSRAEPLCDLARIARHAGDFATARERAAAALALPRSPDILFVDESAHRWRARDEFSLAAYQLGETERAVEGWHALLAVPGIGNDDAERIRANLAFGERRLLEQAEQVRGTPPVGVSDLTVTVTSCRRIGLLRRTLESLRASCEDSNEVSRWLCVDDGSDEDELAALAADLPWLEIHRTPADDRGHAAALRLLWSLVDSDWIFHLEDDWLFPEPFRLGDTLAHVGDAGQLRFLAAPQGPDHAPLVELTPLRRRVLAAHGEAVDPAAETYPWPGFSLNPSLVNLQRLRDLIHPIPDGIDFEFECSVRLRSAGFEIREYPLSIVHIGDTPAYVLAGCPRPADRDALIGRILGCCASDPEESLRLAPLLPLEELPIPDACRLGLAIATAWWYADREQGRRYLTDLWERYGRSGFLFSLEAAELLAWYEESWASLAGPTAENPQAPVSAAAVSPPRASDGQIRVPELRGGAGVTLAMTSCRRLHLWRRTLASFLECCTDHASIDRWICIDDNSTLEDRREMARLAPWMEFVFRGPEERGHARSLQQLHGMISTPYVFLLEDDHEFFVRDDFISRCLHGLSFGTSLGQCLVNRNYAEGRGDADLAGGMAFGHEGQAYIAHLNDPDGRVIRGRSSAWWPHFSLRPGISRLDAWDSGFRDQPAFEYEFAKRYAQAGWITTFLPGIHCEHIGRRVGEAGENAYALNRTQQF